MDSGGAFQVFVGVALLALAAALFTLGRRRPESLTLATFLVLVATNFLAYGLWSRLGLGDKGFQVAFVALALDPFYLLAFVTLYPYKRRPPLVQGLLVLAALLAGATIAATLLAPPEAAVGALAPARVLAVGALVLDYTAAWLLALRGAVEAPTPRLARQGSWVAAAVGIAVLPRLGLLPADFGVSRAESVGVLLATNAAGLAVPAALGAVTWLLLRRWGIPDELRRRVRQAGVAVAGLMLAGLLADVVGGLTLVYPLRWVAFGGMLVYAMLAHEMLEFERARDRAIPALGAFVGGLGVGVVVAVVASAAGVGDAVALGLGLAAGLAALTPVGIATRALARGLEGATGSGSHAERRLELFRAALESAWARGPPAEEQRRLLERERRAFGVSGEEARALEHVVSGGLGNEPPRLRPGDEAATGLVLDRILGEGAHGRVFAARRYPSGERVVVKEFHADLLGSQASRARLLDEFRAVRELDHPNIVRPLEVQATKGRHLLVMQYVEGQPLSELLEKGPLPPGRVRALLLDVLDALEAAHRRGIVHRDVKPSNILVSPQGRAWLTDFGVAATSEGPDVHATISGLAAHGGFAGSLSYMAPEQARGERPGPTADLYAAGLVACHALTGKPPLDLRGLALYQALESVAHPELDLRPAPRAWRPLLERALQRAPSARFRSAEEMRLAVLDLPGDVVGPARR